MSHLEGRKEEEVKVAKEVEKRRIKLYVYIYISTACICILCIEGVRVVWYIYIIIYMCFPPPPLRSVRLFYTPP
jgi:hypothetical protein